MGVLETEGDAVGRLEGCSDGVTEGCEVGVREGDREKVGEAVNVGFAVFLGVGSQVG